MLVETRNHTLSLPAQLLRQAKAYAAEQDLSVNSLVKDLLETFLSSRSRARTAAETLLDLSKHAPLFDGDPSFFRREELYERG